MTEVAEPDPLENYAMGKLLGEGGFAKVRAATHKRTGEKVAMKIIKKSMVNGKEDRKKIEREIHCLKTIYHQNICKLYEIIDTPDRLYFSMEYAPGGELFDYIVARGRLKEPEARKFFRQIVSAVAYCHSLGFIHRDLKPENLLLDNKGTIKLIDFGLVAVTKGPKDNNFLKTACGSPAYAAPELILGKEYFGPQADVWSLGVLLYALLCGCLPFDHDNKSVLYDKILRGHYDIPPWMSLESRSIIAGCLMKNPIKRLTINGLVTHAWTVGKHEPLEWSSRLNKDIIEDVSEQLAAFFNTDNETMHDRIERREYDDVFAMYELLLEKKASNPNSRIRPLSSTSGSPPKRTILVEPEAHVSSAPVTPGVVRRKSKSNRLETGQSPVRGRASVSSRSKSPARSSMIDAVSSPAHSPHGSNRRSLRTPIRQDVIRKDRPRSVVDRSSSMMASIDVQRANSFIESSEAPPSPLMSSSIEGAQDNGDRVRKRGFSLTQLYESVKSKVKTKFPSERGTEPRPIKGNFTSSTTSSKSAQDVLAEVLRVLETMPNIETEQYNYVISCSLQNTELSSKILFEIEVCLVAQMNETSGVRFVRFKGDTWKYKKIVELITRQLKL